MSKQLFRKLLVCYAFVSLAFLSITVRAINMPESAIPDGFVKVGDLKPTYYWIALEEASNDPRSKVLLGPTGEVLARVTEKFHRDIRMEGTGLLLDGRLINFWGWVETPSGREIRYRVCGPDAPYGYGYEDRKLVPFRSVAVDPNVVPLDSDIFIPAAVGTPLPDGTTHDGHFRAIDIGGAIQNLRIDIFTSFGDQSRVFINHGMSNMRPLAVYVKRPTAP